MTGKHFGLPDETAARLSTAVRASVLPEITEAERLALTRYQGLDRFYELVNGVLRREMRFSQLDEDAKERVAATVRGLGMLLDRWSVPDPVRVYRGVRDLSRTFGRLPQPGTRHVLTGFLSASLHSSVARDQFTEPRVTSRRERQPSGFRPLEIQPLLTRLSFSSDRPRRSWSTRPTAERYA